jgi:Fe-S cluster assembly ATPase SufC
MRLLVPLRVRFRRPGTWTWQSVACIPIGSGRASVTHYERLLELIVPDRVHVLADGRIVKSGGKELARELDERGYDWIPAGAGA